MTVAAIPSVWWVLAASFLVFLLLMVLSFTLRMVRQVKQLASTVREASEQLQDALAEVRAESELASEGIERVTDHRRGRPNR